MASGVGSPWGLSPLMVAGIEQTLDRGDTHLTGQLGMTSTPLTFNKNNYISPLTMQNRAYYTHSFGKSRKSLKTVLKTVLGHIRYLKNV
jgi:hypothetical protein